MKTVSTKYCCYCELLRKGQLTLQPNHEKGEEGKGTIPDFKIIFKNFSEIIKSASGLFGS